MFTKQKKEHEEQQKIVQHLTRLVENTQNTQQNAQESMKKIETVSLRIEHIMEDLREKEGLSQEKYEKVQKVGDEFEKRLRSFDLLLGKIENKVFSKLNENISNQLDMFRREIKDFSNTKERVQEMTQIMGELKKEAAKVSDVTTKIKQNDYELNKYAKALEKTDREKLRLMKENEKLQKLIGALRRKMRD